MSLGRCNFHRPQISHLLNICWLSCHHIQVVARWVNAHMWLCGKVERVHNMCLCAQIHSNGTTHKCVFNLSFTYKIPKEFVDPYFICLGFVVKPTNMGVWLRKCNLKKKNWLMISWCSLQNILKNLIDCKLNWNCTHHPTLALVHFLQLPTHCLPYFVSNFQVAYLGLIPSSPHLLHESPN